MVEYGTGRKLLLPRNPPGSQPQENEDREDLSEMHLDQNSRGYRWENEDVEEEFHMLLGQQFKDIPKSGCSWKKQ